ADTPASTPPLPDALPISAHVGLAEHVPADEAVGIGPQRVLHADDTRAVAGEAIRQERQRRRLLEGEDRQPLEGAAHRGRRSTTRSEEHTSELQSRVELVC